MFLNYLLNLKTMTKLAHYQTHGQWVIEFPKPIKNINDVVEVLENFLSI